MYTTSYTSSYSSTTETSEEIITTETPCEGNPPEVTITGIEDEGTYSGRVTIEVSATDESDIVKAEITIKDGDFDETEEF